MKAGSVLLAAGLALATPAWACGPFLYENAELDQFSLIDPGILNTREWVRFLAFASPAYGQASQRGGDDSWVQPVIHADREPDLLEGTVDNWLYETAPGEDPESVAANEAWWIAYFKTVRSRAVKPEELKAVLEGPDRPRWLVAADRKYLALLSLGPDDTGGLATALTEARNPRNPEGLRHRFAFWAVRAQVLLDDPAAVTTFREFCPGPAPDLPLARAQGWAASLLLASQPQQALALWVDLFVRWPALRVQTFSSLTRVDAATWAQADSPGARVARFFVEGRDFAPETLAGLARAEQKAGGDGSWTETVLYAMAEQVEREAGVFALFSLVDPAEVNPRGLFTGLIDQAAALARAGLVKPTRTWWLLCSYLALFDGDPDRARSLLLTARGLPARTEEQTGQTELLGTLLQMDQEKDRDWSPALQSRVLAALAWGQHLDQPDHNRGLYHSVVVLAAQKYLARGQNPQAVLAFGLLRPSAWSSPYHVSADDGFWATAWPSNNPVNLLMDALMSDEDLVQWRALNHATGLEPLTAHLAASRFLSDRDLTWWQAHRALRRGQGPAALALLKTMGPEPDVESEVFPARRFSYSLDLDPLDPGSGRSLRTVSPLVLAGVMARIEEEARLRPTAQALLAQGQFWFSLQLSGLPLLFSQPPTLISFTNGNFEYYGYDGRDQDHRTNVVGEFPLGRPTQTDTWARRLNQFYQTEFSLLGRARAAFRAVLARHDNPEAEYRALLFLQAIDHDQGEGLGSSRYDKLELAKTFRDTCEDFQQGLL